MKKGKVLLCAVLTVLLLPGCTPGRESVSSDTVSGADVSLPSESRTAVSSAVPGGLLQQDENPSVSGRNHDFDLYSLDFSDADTGWVIQTRYGADGAARSQLLSTKDGGTDWRPVGKEESIPLLAIRFVSRTEGWAVSCESVDSGSQARKALARYRILHTGDGGENWETQWQSDAQNKTDPGLYFSDNRVGYALVGNRLLATKTGGKEWTALNLGISDFQPVKIHFSDAQNGWAAGTDGKKETLFVLNTSDCGKNWKKRFQKKFDEGAAGCAGIDFLNAKEGWFLTSDLSTWNGELYHTADGGNTWASVGTVKSVRPTPEGIDFTDSQTGWVPLNVGAGPVAGGLAVTRDGGKSFQVLGDTANGVPETTRKIQSARQVMFLSERTGWAVGSDPVRGDCLLHTEDGGTTWEQKYPQTSPDADFSFVNAQQGFGLGRLGDPNAFLKTEDGGQSWSEIYSFAGEYQVEKLSFISTTEGWILALPVDSESGEEQTVLHTEDGGKTWRKAGGFKEDSFAGYFRFFSAGDGIAVLSGGRDRILRTQDGGKTWEASEAEGSEGRDVFAFLSPDTGWRAVNLTERDSARVLFSGTARDDPGGISFRAPSEAVSGAACRAMAFLSGGRGVMLAEKTDGKKELLTTEDGGKTWSPHPFSADSAETMEFLQGGGDQVPMQFADDAHGWILTSHGLLQTRDGGRSWSWL